MLRKLLHKYVEEVITAGLLLLATAILQVFRSRISALTATISHKTLLPQLLAVSTISCGYLGWKYYALWRRTKQKEVVRFCRGVEFQIGPKTGRRWMPFCPKCHVVLEPHWDGFGMVHCSAGCGWSSTITAQELAEILSGGDK